MIPRKFKVGDLVRVRSGLIDGLSYGGLVYHKKRMEPGWESKIVLIDPCGILLRGSNVRYSENMLELVPVSKDEIVIYRVGNKVVARDTTTLEYAEAICNPADVFNFGYGAKLALSRLTDKSLYNGRVFCVSGGIKCVAFRGYIYEIKDGVLIGDDGVMLNETNPIKSVDELNDTYPEYGNFIEIKN